MDLYLTRFNGERISGTGVPDRELDRARSRAYAGHDLGVGQQLFFSGQVSLVVILSIQIETDAGRVDDTLRDA